MRKKYINEFYNWINQGSQISARIIIPILINFIHPKSVVDVGCGTGIWLKECMNREIKDVMGLDGPWVTIKSLQIPRQKFLKANLNKPLNLKRSFNMALCLEVAEHLSPASSSILVKTLTKLSPVVVFSAAIPGQGGYKHINEQWLDYWEKKFSKLNYILIDSIRPIIWDNEAIEWWYAQNMVFFIKKDRVKSFRKLFLSYRKPQPWQYHLVHPRCFQQINNSEIKKKRIDQSFSKKQDKISEKIGKKVKKISRNLNFKKLLSAIHLS